MAGASEPARRVCSSSCGRASFERKRVVLASGRESDFFIDCKQAVLTAEGHALVGEMMLDALAQLPAVRRRRRRRARRVPARERRLAHELPARRAARCGLRAQGREGPRLEARRSRATRASPAGARLVLLEDVVTTGRLDAQGRREAARRGVRRLRRRRARRPARGRPRCNRERRPAARRALHAHGLHPDVKSAMLS